VLCGKKCYPWGTFTRSLTLYSQEKIDVVVQRIYCPDTERTYSLLPFYITRYQRFVNTIIEDVFKSIFIDGQSCEEIEQNGPPLRKTITRWKKWILARIDKLRKCLAELLIKEEPEYFSVSSAKWEAGKKLEELLENAKMLASEEDILLYGSLSYIFYRLQENSF